MEKHRKQAVIISTIGVVMILFGVTYSFFNYTRTGVSNTIRVGRIYFNSEQTNTITLVDVFPIDKTTVNSSNDVGTVTINIEGDTTYDDGVEYQLTVSNLTNTVGNKEIPIDVVVTASGVGDSEDDYFNERGGNSSIYKVLTTGTISNNKQLLVGYIPKGSTGVDGTVTIKAYLDKEKIAISDTYPASSHIDVEGEDIFEYNQHPSSSSINKCVSYIMSVGYDYYLQTGETIDSFCAGTGTLYRRNFQYWYENSWFTEEDIDYLKSINIFIQTSFATETGYIDNTTKEWANGRMVLTTTEWNNIHANGVSFQVKVEANEGIWASEPGDLQLKKAILAKEADTNVQCSNITYEEDNITYFSGTNECVDMNYVWYSGKLWRITNIYPDGSMKLITEDMITSINWGENEEYDGSWVYQWLNEDFYDTLDNPNDIIKSNSVWNYSMDYNTPPSKPETISTQKTKTAPVGLLTAYEYYNSNRCINSLDCSGSNYLGYLVINYCWWLITQNSTNRVFNVEYNGGLSYSEPYSRAAGVRPSIVIRPGLQFTGNGTITSPYKIVGDKEEVVNNTTLLSSRSIGEYVKFDNLLYRIVDTSNGITKLTAADYLKGPCENCYVNSGNVVSKKFASSVYYGKEGNTASDDYWDYYLNNTWYNSISSTYKNMLVDGTYYLGLYFGYANYKSTICKDNNIDTMTTKNCTKYTSTDTDKTFTGKVGLPRVGEMFSSQMSPRDFSSTQYIFTLTPVTTMEIRSVSVNGYLYTLNHSNSYAVRPSITLKSGIKITGGKGYVGGNTNSPFEISE